MDKVYDSDILVWSEQQAELLRRLAAGERVNEQLDWENLIEEVESVGREQLHAVESLLLQALVHMLKAQRGRRPQPNLHVSAARPCLFDAVRLPPAQRPGRAPCLFPCSPTLRSV